MESCRQSFTALTYCWKLAWLRAATVDELFQTYVGTLHNIVDQRVPDRRCRRRHLVVSSGRRVAPPWPRRMACLQRLTGTEPVTLRQCQRARGRPWRRLQSPPNKWPMPGRIDNVGRCVLESPEWAELCGWILTSDVFWWSPNSHCASVLVVRCRMPWISSKLVALATLVSLRVPLNCFTESSKNLSWVLWCFYVNGWVVRCYRCLWVYRSQVCNVKDTHGYVSTPAVLFYSIVFYR